MLYYRFIFVEEIICWVLTFKNECRTYTDFQLRLVLLGLLLRRFLLGLLLGRLLLGFLLRLWLWFVWFWSFCCCFVWFWCVFDGFFFGFSLLWILDVISFQHTSLNSHFSPNFSAVQKLIKTIMFLRLNFKTNSSIGRVYHLIIWRFLNTSFSAWIIFSGILLIIPYTYNRKDNVHRMSHIHSQQYFITEKSFKKGSWKFSKFIYLQKNA